MQNKLILFKNKMRMAKLLFVIFILFFVCNISACAMKSTYYPYQWALKNNGNFFVSKEILDRNNEVKVFDKVEMNNYFAKNKEDLDKLIKKSVDTNYTMAKEKVDLNWEEAYKIFKDKNNKRDVVVAIIDSGVDIENKSLKESIWINSKEIANNGIDDDKNGYIDDINGWNFCDNSSSVYKNSEEDIHGTHAAGTIVASHNVDGTKGVAYDSHIKVMPLKILGENGKGLMTSLIEAINYACNNGAVICNISLGTYKYDESLDLVIKSHPNTLFVVAAGNGESFVGYSLDIKNVYPAKLGYDNVITVSNINFNGIKYISANFGSYVDIFVPGTFILSTIPKDKFGFLTGTSMAAPFVSAAAAMLYSCYDNINIKDYKNILIESSNKIDELRDFSKSEGILDLKKMFDVADALSEEKYE